MSSAIGSRWSAPDLKILLLAALASSCDAVPDATVPELEAAYTATADGQLRVRDELWPRLRLAHVSTTDIEAELAGIGRLEFAPDAAYAVRVPFPAYVEHVHVTAGAQVRAGDKLATLRSGEVARLRSDIRRLDATISARRDAVARYKRLVAEGAGSPRELVEAEAELAGAEAELRGVREAVRAARANTESADLFILRASADGQVLQRYLDPGERVSLDDVDPAFLIGDAGRLIAMTAFPERDAALLHEGYPCSFTVPALGASRFEGTLQQVVQSLDRTTRTASAACVPRAPDLRLRAEMAASVSAIVRGDDALAVPRSAVLLRRDVFVVFVGVGEHLLERRTVELGAQIGDQIQIISGLSAGESVVVDNAVLLDGELDRLL